MIPKRNRVLQTAGTGFSRNDSSLEDLVVSYCHGDVEGWLDAAQRSKLHDYFEDYTDADAGEGEKEEIEVERAGESEDCEEVA